MGDFLLCLGESDEKWMLKFSGALEFLPFLGELLILDGGGDGVPYEKKIR